MPKLVNLGSLCVDNVYRVGHIARAGETIASHSYEIFAGGKGLNQSIAAANAGATVEHFGAVGPDGQLLIDTLVAHNVGSSGVVRLGEASGHAVIQVDSSGHNSIVIHGGANRALSSSLIGEALETLGPGDWLLLQNEVNDLAQIMLDAASRGAKIALNLAPADESVRNYPLETVQLLIVNEIEAMVLSGAADGETAFATLRHQWPEVSIVLTLGEVGALAWDAPCQSVFRVGSFAVTAVDETAAGDAYVGFLLAALVRGDELERGLRQGAAAGALTVTRAGAADAIPGFSQVEALLAAQPLQLKEIADL